MEQRTSDRDRRATGDDRSRSWPPAAVFCSVCSADPRLSDLGLAPDAGPAPPFAVDAGHHARARRSRLSHFGSTIARRLSPADLPVEPPATEAPESRLPCPQERSAQPGCYQVAVVVEGPVRIDTGTDSGTIAAPGDLVLTLEWGPGSGPTDRHLGPSLRLPRAMIDVWLPAEPRATTYVIPRSFGLGALLSDYVTDLAPPLQQASHPVRAAAARNLGHLLALAIKKIGIAGVDEAAAPTAAPAPAPPPTLPRSVARLDQVRAFIDAHLADFELNPATVADRVGISKRSLHLLFHDTGESFSEYVSRRRVEKCRALLTDPGRRPASITDAAFDCGFSNLSTFYRAFRKVYGINPRDLR